MSPKDSLSRRSVLKTTSGALAGFSATGLAAAGSRNTVEVNVGFSAESGRKAALAAASEVVREFGFDALTVRLPADAASSLEARADVCYVEENGTAELLGQTLPWGIDRIDADVAHVNDETGNGADVAIIDTGIDDDHPDLQANLGEGKAFHTCTDSCSACGFCNASWDDDHGHGTAVAGVADAVDDTEGVVGVCTETTLHAVKVFDCEGQGTHSDIAAGIEWVADQGYDVANMSFGNDSGSSILHDAVQYAHASGVTQVAAAGNDGLCFDCVDYPAAYSEVIAVSATSCDDTLVYFSSTGPEVELAAPGDDVYTTTCDGGYDTFDGTSYAAAHVSGAGGQLRANGYSNTEARDRLNSTAEDIGLPSNEQGNGLVDVAAALGYDSSDDGTGNGLGC